MKLDSADLSLSNGQVITVLDLTIDIIEAAEAIARHREDALGQAKDQDSTSARWRLHGKTAAAIRVGTEISLDALPSSADRSPTASVFVSRIEPADSSPIHFTSFYADSAASLCGAS